jgi:glycosyltransferase involved in cell wall biosynthesis
MSLLVKKPDISIIIANYNNGHFIKDCIDSLVNQSHVNWEAIIVDDCSTDDSVKTIRQLIQNDNRFELVLNKKNEGYQKTLIRAIDLAQAPLFARVDPDDALTVDAIKISVETHSQYPEVGLVYSNLIICDERLQTVSVSRGKQIYMTDELFLNYNREIAHFATFKKSFYLMSTGIDSFIKRAEDQDIYLKMLEVAPVKYVDHDLYLYRVHPLGLSNVKNGDRAFFWHWVAIIKMAERRGLNIEDIFINEFVHKTKVRFNKRIITYALKNELHSLLNYARDILRRVRNFAIFSK